MKSKKIYSYSSYIIALVFLIEIVLEIWKGTLFSSMSKILVAILFILAFYLERYKIKNREENEVLKFASFLVVIWFVVNLLIGIYSLVILNEFKQEDIFYGTLGISSFLGILKATSSDFGGFLLITIIIDLIGISLNQYYHPKKKLRSWIHGGLLGIASLLLLTVVLSLTDTSCAKTNFLNSWGGQGCNSIGEYISVHIFNFVSSFFFMITSGLPVTIISLALFFGIGALIGYWVEDKS